MWIPGKVFPVDIRKHLADEHQLEASDNLSVKELSELHERLHRKE